MEIGKKYKSNIYITQKFRSWKPKKNPNIIDNSIIKKKILNNYTKWFKINK